MKYGRLSAAKSQDSRELNTQGLVRIASLLTLGAMIVVLPCADLFGQSSGLGGGRPALHLYRRVYLERHADDRLAFDDGGCGLQDWAANASGNSSGIR